jgi:hypothetical protein
MHFEIASEDLSFGGFELKQGFHVQANASLFGYKVGSDFSLVVGDLFDFELEYKLENTGLGDLIKPFF